MNAISPDGQESLAVAGLQGVRGPSLVKSGPATRSALPRPRAATIRDVGIDTNTLTGLLLLRLPGAFADIEPSLIREHVLAGVRRAHASGKHCGRTRKDVDLRPALALLNEGRGLKDVARILRVPRATLRRRLEEAGRRPVERAAAQWVQMARSVRGVCRLFFGVRNAGPERGPERTGCGDHARPEGARSKVIAACRAGATLRAHRV